MRLAELEVGVSVQESTLRRPLVTVGLVITSGRLGVGSASASDFGLSSLLRFPSWEERAESLPKPR